MKTGAGGRKTRVQILVQLLKQRKSKKFIKLEMLGIKIVVSSTTCTSMAIHLTTEMTINFPQKYQSPKEIS